MTHRWNRLRSERDRFSGDPKCIGCTFNLVMSVSGLRCGRSCGGFEFCRHQHTQHTQVRHQVHHLYESAPIEHRLRITCGDGVCWCTRCLTC